jgi:hypothetical protein
MTRLFRTVGVTMLAIGLSAHVGSPDVFFAGKAGPYELRVVVRPPDVVPGVARVTVRAPAAVEQAFIRPIYWRAGSKGAPSADPASRLQGTANTFEGSIWLMARGAYTVEVTVDGASGPASVRVPVASVATGQLAMNAGLGTVLLALGVVLVGGLVNIVYKSAGESLVDAGNAMDDARRRQARRVAGVAVPIVALGLLGGARWWGAVDRDYDRTIYRPSPLTLALEGSVLHLAAQDTIYQPPSRPSSYVADHGKLMHLFLVRADGATAFAHLHPRAVDSSAVPAFTTVVPPLPGGRYHVYGDVVHETGFERTLVGELHVPDSMPRGAAPSDPDDAWYIGNPSRALDAPLAGGLSMQLRIEPQRPQAGQEVTIRVAVRDSTAQEAVLEPYLGMAAHGVVARADGQVYVHLHPMGTFTTAAVDALLARDRGDTTATGRIRSSDHPAHAMPTTLPGGTVEFPYAFPTAGDYRLFVQVKHGGRILTAAFALAIENADSTRAR